MNDLISAAIALVLLSIVIVVMIRNRQMDERINYLSTMSIDWLKRESTTSDCERHREFCRRAILKKGGA